MIKNIVLACIIGVVIAIGCEFVGRLLMEVDVKLAIIVGSFLREWHTAFGILAALWYFFTHQTKVV